MILCSHKINLLMTYVSRVKGITLKIVCKILCEWEFDSFLTWFLTTLSFSLCATAIMAFWVLFLQYYTYSQSGLYICCSLCGECFSISVTCSLSSLQISAFNQIRESQPLCKKLASLDSLHAHMWWPHFTWIEMTYIYVRIPTCLYWHD